MKVTIVTRSHGAHSPGLGLRDHPPAPLRAHPDEPSEAAGHVALEEGSSPGAPTGRPKTLRVEGKLSGPWVEELENAWRKARAEAPAEHIIADLSGVTFVDSEGRSLLERMLQQGAELRADRLLPRFVINEIKAHAAARLEG